MWPCGGQRISWWMPSRSSFAIRFATRILGPELAAELKRTPDAGRKPFSAGLRSWMIARARFAEDVLADAVRGRGAAQYLVLGAGLDTFALRNPYPGVRVFEIDHPATQAWKRGLLTAAGLSVPASAVLVSVNFEQQSLRRELLQAGFDLKLPTVTAWLGVVPYLTPEAFAGTCRVLGGFASGSDAVFDYGQPREVLPPVEQLMHDSLAARVAQAGEPFRLYFTPQELAAELPRYGLAVVEDLGSVGAERTLLRQTVRWAGASRQRWTAVSCRCGVDASRRPARVRK